MDGWVLQRATVPVVYSIVVVRMCGKGRETMRGSERHALFLLVFFEVMTMDCKAISLSYHCF